MTPERLNRSGTEFTEQKMLRLENDFLAQHISHEKVIFALGPNMCLRDNWSEFASNVTLVRLDKSANAVMRGLKHRREEKIKRELTENGFGDLADSPNYGCWDVDVMLSPSLEPYSHNEAQNKVQKLIDDFNKRYQTSTFLDCKPYPSVIECRELYEKLGI
ncbi:MAG: hypothetical protein IPK73_12255 [Candidatus Obscuribacter sp.]|nr:hypothetical protein [Candidatus Obscuribacter sp.]MBK9281795.1 hypothetical protein [Candidatus Obscuribacter sp.]